MGWLRSLFTPQKPALYFLPSIVGEESARICVERDEAKDNRSCLVFVSAACSIFLATLAQNRQLLNPRIKTVDLTTLVPELTGVYLAIWQSIASSFNTRKLNSEQIKTVIDQLDLIYSRSFERLEIRFDVPTFDLIVSPRYWNLHPVDLDKLMEGMVTKQLRPIEELLGATDFIGSQKIFVVFKNSFIGGVEVAQKMEGVELPESLSEPMAGP